MLSSAEVINPSESRNRHADGKMNSVLRFACAHMAILMRYFLMSMAAVAAAAAGVDALETRAAAQYVEAINSGDRMTVQHYVTEHYDPAMFKRIPVGMVAALHMASYYISGGLGYNFHSATDTEGKGLGAVLQNRLTGAWVELHLPTAPGAPEKLAGFPRLQPVSTPADATAPGKLSDEQIVARLEKCMHLLAADDEFAGVVLLSRNSEPLFQQPYGLASKSFQIPNQLDTKFNIASVGKVFTGVAIAQLAERGALSFEDPVSKYLPADWLAPEGAEKIQVRHLLTHTAGLGDYFRKLYGQYDQLLFRDLEDYKMLVADETLSFEPGTRSAYSNAGMLLAGVVIEQVSGMSYFDYVREHIWKPAGMTNSGDWSKDQPVLNRAAGYTKEPTDSGARWWTNIVTRVMKGSPSGGCYSTGPDLLRFAIALRAHKLLSPEYTEIVLSGKPEINAPNAGYGFYVSEGAAGRIAQHSGDGRGINAEFSIYLDAGYTLIVLSNYNRPAADIVEQVIHQMLIAGH